FPFFGSLHSHPKALAPGVSITPRIRRSPLGWRKRAFFLGAAGQSVRAGLDRGPGPQQVLTENLADVRIRIAARLQPGNQVREVRHRLQAVCQLAVDTVEVRTDTDVVDADQLDRVVDLVEDRVDR